MRRARRHWRARGARLMAWTGLVWALACGRDKARAPVAPPESAPRSTASVTEGSATDKGEAAPGEANPGRFCIRALELEDTTPPPLRIAGLWSEGRRADLQRQLAAVEAVEVIALGQDPQAPLCARDGPSLAQVGVLLRFEYGLIDAEGKAQRPGDLLRDGQLHFAVTAHAERLGSDGRPEIAQATPTGAVPMAAARVDDLATYAAVRLSRAAAMATADALGQLWARHLPDAQVLATLGGGDPWRRAAAIREAGERGLTEGREAIERAAADSRRDLAVVAAAALGRLGDARSLPVLQACLSHRDPEVIDAALSALADMPGAEARTLLEGAKSHPHPWIRQRASSLLER